MEEGIDNVKRSQCIIYTRECLCEECPWKKEYIMLKEANV